MFKRFWLDTILGTAFIFAFLLAASNLTYFKIFDVLDPFGDAIEDMETTDIVFSQIRGPQLAEENIVLVNIGELSRPEIAYMISVISSLNPRVIGVDTFFRTDKDSIGDAMLEEAFANVDNLILASQLFQPNDNGTFDSLGTSIGRFARHGQTAFANFITGAQSQEDLKACRTFTPREIAEGEEELALAVKLAQFMDPEKTQKFLDRGREIERINYKGNVIDYGATKFGTTYFALDHSDVFNENFVPELIEGKCVIFCFLGEFLGDREALEDKYFTPLNSKYAGKAHADMFGGVIHANIVSMILNENYIGSMSENMSIFLAVLICYLNVIAFTFIYKVMPKWYDGLTKLIQIIEAFALFTLIIIVFNAFDYVLELTYTIIVVLLAGDLLEIYYGVVKNLFSKEGRKELTKLNKL